MDYKKGIGYGALLWVLMFVIISALIGFKVYEGVVVKVIMALVGGIISYILAGIVKPKSNSEAVGLGITFVIVGVILDAIITVRFNSEIFISKALWFSYALVLLAPLLTVKSKQN